MPVIPALEAHNTGGRLATRLIEDWYHGILQHADKSEPRVQSCYHLRGTRPAPAGVSDDHDLIEVPSQTHQSVISCLCKHCRYHFAFSWSSSPVTGPDHLQHHFVITDNSDESFGEEKGKQVLGPHRWDKRLVPLVRQTNYRCSSCNFHIRLEVTAPRLDSRWIDMVTDESRAKRNLKRAMHEDPARFRDMAPEKLTKLETGALLTLNMYITNIMSSDPSVPDKITEKKISERNKTFMVQFGPECEELFLYLGFKKRQEVDEAFYISPREPPKEGGKTDLYTERAFFEDVKSEIQSVIDQKATPGHHVKPHSSARHDLETALGCGDVHKLTPGHLTEDEQHYYCLLGASPSSTDATLRWAYEQQTAVDPDHKRYYVEALSNLAYKKGEDLQLFAIAEQESAAVSSKLTQETSEYDKDWAWFGFSREADRSLDKNQILQRYNEYRDWKHPERHLHRLHLAKIGRDLQQQDLVDIAAKDMDEEEANGVLEVSPVSQLDYVANAAMASVINKEKDVAVVAAAMNIVGDKNFHHLGTAPYAEFEKISGQLTALLGGESQDRYFSGSFDLDQGTETKDGDLTLPAGLVNLRNTCYLNSILQYLHTVDVIRDLLQNMDLDTLDASTEKMGEILGGVEEVERKEAWLGHEFARELKTLFQEMEETTSVHVKPRQRLANAALARAGKVGPTAEFKAAESMTTDSKVTDPTATELMITEFTDAESKATEPMEVAPPLPPRNSEEAVTVEHVETASISSSQTLVGEAAPAVARTTGLEKRKGTEKKKEMDKVGPVEDLAKELDKEEVKGTDQQDVDEAMGNILEHLQAAVKLARARRKVGEEGGKEEISDPVDNHFYSDFVIHSQTRGANSWNKRDDRNRLVMVPLHETKGVKEDLYQVIGHGMDVQLNEETKLMTFTAIKKPADILHFLFPRSGQDGKNENPVELNDPLYLDHFMEVEDTEDERFRTKTRLWAINRRLEELRASKDKAVPEPNSEKVLVDEDMERFLGVDLEVDIDGDYELVDVNEGPAKEIQAVTVTPEKLTEFSDWLRVEEASEEEKLTREREALLANGEVEYRLHAVFCHRGSTGYGHYWVWIKDFERGVWRKYNDNTVTLHTEQEFRRDAGCAPEPCWAAYVRAGKTGLVSIPIRKGVDREQVEGKVKQMMAQKGDDTPMGGAGGWEPSLKTFDA
ncbi:putative ubiquitin carboxyl-terminal hydrolase 2 [Triangularia setosa]|uniref:ubiquitinyl hydrolase 1 n=1 Tax=Triangularia setosa TaxID=2587417 RepID=A0AAN7A922_9PEZI|nr:putative ubiquitin carboxyl-terminal hydrolase 2 [Podospora setosa]